jgi:hypothetical protein
MFRHIEQKYTAHMAKASWVIVVFGEAEWSERRGAHRCLRETAPDGRLCNVKRLADVSGHWGRGGPCLALHVPAGLLLCTPLTA